MKLPLLKNLPHLATATALTLAFTACEKKPASTAAAGAATPAAAAAAPSAELAKVLATAPAAGAQAIHTARTTAKPGDEITLTGRIMGNEKPFVAGRAVFILGDPELLTACNEMPGDTCTTPWDVCCEPPEEKKAGTATIQIAGADGKVLKEGLEGVGGLKPLVTLTVTGKVAEGSSADLLLVNATAIQVK